MENREAEAKRRFNALTIDEKLEEVWFGMRGLRALGEGMLLRQDKANGGVERALTGLAAHLEVHRMEKRERDFIKRWGGRGTGIAVAAIAAVGGGGGLLAIVDWVRG